MKDMLCVISIASHGIYMKIFQKKGTAVKIIDKAVHVSLIGKEVFFEDKLTFNKIKEIIDTVKKMKIIAEGYQTDKIVDGFGGNFRIKLAFDHTAILHSNSNNRILCHNNFLSFLTEIE